jgi:ankyrin repeat protein
VGKGASPTFQDRDGKSALHLAAACGHLSCLATLLGNISEDVSELQDSQGCTVLHWACYNGEEMVSRARRNNNRIKNVIQSCRTMPVPVLVPLTSFFLYTIFYSVYP